MSVQGDVSKCTFCEKIGNSVATLATPLAPEWATVTAPIDRPVTMEEMKNPYVIEIEINEEHYRFLFDESPKRETQELAAALVEEWQEKHRAVVLHGDALEVDYRSEQNRPVLSRMNGRIYRSVERDGAKAK